MPAQSYDTLWKQFYRDALFELDPTLLQSKLQIARNAIESCLSDLPSHGVSREVLDLTNAKRMLGYLQNYDQQI
jgi:hypothetical protein